MSQSLVFLSKDKTDLLTSSDKIADSLNYDHRSVIQLVRTHQSDIEEFGRVTFEMLPFKTKGGEQKKTVACLNEHQAMLLICYMKNTEKVRVFKKALIKAFFAMREKLQGKLQAPLAEEEKKELINEMFLAGYRGGFECAYERIQNEQRVSFTEEELDNLLTAYQALFDERQKMLENMRKVRIIIDKLQEIKDGFNFMWGGYIATHAIMLDKLKALKQSMQLEQQAS